MTEETVRTRVRPIVFSDPALSRAELDVIHTLITSAGLVQDTIFDIAHYSLPVPGPADITLGGSALLAYRTSVSSEPALHLPSPSELLREGGIPASRQKAWEGIAALAQRLRASALSPLTSFSLSGHRWLAHLSDGRCIKVVPSRTSEAEEGETIELRELSLLVELANLLGITKVEVVQE